MTPDGLVVIMTGEGEGIAMSRRMAIRMAISLISVSEQSRIAFDPEAALVKEWISEQK